MHINSHGLNAGFMAASYLIMHDSHGVRLFTSFRRTKQRHMAAFTSDVACMACLGPVFYEGPDGSMGNAYMCETHTEHVHCCIMCAYTYFRTKLMSDQPLKCYDPQCKRVFTLDEQTTIAKCSLNAEEFLEFFTLFKDRLAKKGLEARGRALDQVQHDSLDTVMYAAKNCKRCPECLVRVEKVSGCDDVHCQHCGSRFQYSAAINYLDHDELARRQAAAKQTSTRASRRAVREVVRLTYFQSS